jgi:hypothetical protein
MARTAEQRAKRREKRKARKRKANKQGNAKPNKGAAPAKAGKKRNRKQKKQGRNRPSAGNVTVPRVMSAVNDGVNTGMVWKNTSEVEDFFKPRFEKVSDLVTTGTAFAIIKQFFINPGNSTLFPVFAKIAATYEQYRCHLLRFWYRGEEYTASGTNVSAGILVYATNFDIDDTAFSGIDQMENYDNSISGPPFAGHFAHDVLVGHRKKGRNRAVGGNDLPLNDYFVFSSANAEAPTGLSQAGKFYDMGNFQVASNGTQAATPAGELWVEHSWTMIRRKQSTPLGQELTQGHIVSSAAGTAATATILGTTGGVLRSGSNLTTVLTTTTFTLPNPGYYLVAMGLFGTLSSASAPSLGVGSNITPLQVMNNNGSSASTATNTGGTQSAYLALLSVTASGTGAANTCTPACASYSAGNTDIFISQVSSGLTKPPVVTVEQRLRDLEAMINRRYLVEPDSDFECKTPLAVSSSSSSSLSLDRSVHLSREAVRTLLAGSTK